MQHPPQPMLMHNLLAILPLFALFPVLVVHLLGFFQPRHLAFGYELRFMFFA